MLCLVAKCLTFDLLLDFCEIFGALSSNQKESCFLISGSSIESFLIISCFTPAKIIYSFKLAKLNIVVNNKKALVVLIKTYISKLLN